VLSAIAEDIARRVYEPGFPGGRDAAVGMMLPAKMESRLTTLLLQVDWQPQEGYAHPWEKWLSGVEDETFSAAVYRTLFYKDFLHPNTAYSSRRAVQLREFSVGNTLGADMSGMTLFNPQEHLKICLYSKAFEAYPNYSMVRWMAWQVYIDSALSSLRY